MQRTYDDDGKQKLCLQVVHVVQLDQVVERVQDVDATLGVQVAIATDQLRRTVGAEADVLELCRRLLQLHLRLGRQSD